MSALEHIRKHPALIISVLGLALVLFIITAVSDNIFSFFGDRDTAVKVDGEKLKYEQWRIAASQITDNMRRQGQEDVDAAYVDELALQNIVDEELLNKQIQRLGIKVTDEEMASYLFGEASIASAEAQQYGFPSAEDFYNYAFSNDPNAADARALWNDMENRIRKQILSAKFQMQLGAIKANKLDAKIYFDENKNVTLNVAKVDYVGLKNEDFNVTDDEIKARYNETKETYRLDNEVRMLDYIMVTPTPSAADASFASSEVEDAIVGLKSTPGTEAIAANSSFETSVVSGSVASLPAHISKAIDKIQADTVALLSFSGSAYNIAKLLSVKTAVEKADVDFFFTDNNTLAIDSVIASINAGNIAQYGDSLQKVSKKELNLINNADLANFAEKFINAGSDAVIVTDADFKSAILTATFGSQIDPASMDMDAVGISYKVNSVEAAQPIYEIAAITRKLVPSEETINTLRKNLVDYSVKNATAESLVANIANSSFHIEKGRVSNDRFAIIGSNGQRIPNTVSLVAWAMQDAKKGDVSEVIDAGDSFIVVALSDIYDGGYVPVTDPDVKESIAAQLRAEKKGAKLVADYNGKGKSVEEYATAMNTSAITLRANYAQNDAGVFRGDAKFLAAVGAAEKGKIVGPIATNSAAVVFEVTNVDNAAGDFDFKKVASMAGRQFQFNVSKALRGNKKIDYKALRFEARE